MLTLLLFPLILVKVLKLKRELIGSRCSKFIGSLLGKCVLWRLSLILVPTMDK